MALAKAEKQLAEFLLQIILFLMILFETLRRFLISRTED